MPLPRVVRLSLLLFPWAVLLGILHAEDRTRAFDEATCKAAGLSADGPALLDFFRKRTPNDADLARLGENVRRLGDRSYRVRAQASATLKAAGRSAVPLLRQALQGPDAEIGRRAEECLRHIESKS